MSSSDQQSNSHNNQNQLIAAFNAQQERIAMLENQLSHMIQSQQVSNLTNNTSTLKPPKPEYFEGKNVDTFLFSLEKIFNYHNIESENKVQLAVTYFRGPALRWYRYVESQPSNLTIINDWKSFTRMLKKHFQPANTETIIRNKLNSLRQLGAVNKYSDLFNSLIIEVLEMDEKTKLDMYCRGLKPNIRLQVMLRAPSSLEEAQITALNVDNILNSNSFGVERNQQPNYRRNNYHSFNSSVNESTPMDLGNIDNRHIMDDNEAEEQLHAIRYGARKPLRKPTNEQTNKFRNERKCFHCQRVEHIARNCRTPNKEN